MDAKQALHTAIAVRRKLNRSDLVSANDRKAAVKFLDDLVPFLANIEPPQPPQSTPSQHIKQRQYGLLQYPGNKLIGGPYSDTLDLIREHVKHDPDAVRVVFRDEENAPWTYAR